MDGVQRFLARNSVNREFVVENATRQEEDDEDIELIVGSGNVFADVGLPNADELQFKADIGVAICNLIE